MVDTTRPARLDRQQLAIAICEIPTYLREHRDMSLAVRLEEILSLRTEPVREADLAATLSVNPQLLDSWAAYVQDQRTADGWYVAVSKATTPGPEWTLALPGRTKRLTFDSPTAAYAALILRIVAPGLLKAPSGLLRE